MLHESLCIYHSAVCADTRVVCAYRFMQHRQHPHPKLPSRRVRPRHSTARPCPSVPATSAESVALMAPSHPIDRSLLRQQRLTPLSSPPRTPPAPAAPRPQAVGCGEAWLAHVGGAAVTWPRYLGPRREFLLLGEAVRRAGGALQEAPPGTVVVEAAAWPCLADLGVCAVPTPSGHFRVVPPAAEAAAEATGTGPGGAEDGTAGHEAEAEAEEQEQEEEGGGCAGGEWGVSGGGAAPGWIQLRHYCHEGARDLQDVAAYAGDVREVTVLFVLLHVLLERGGGGAGGEADGGVATAHAALLAIQAAVYARPGGSLQVRRAARRIKHRSPRKLLTRALSTVFLVCLRNSQCGIILGGARVISMHCGYR